MNRHATAEAAVGRAPLLTLLLPQLFLLCLLHFTPQASATLDLCGSSVDGSTPAAPVVHLSNPALAYLNATRYDAYACSLTFAQHAAAHADWVTCFHAPVPSVHTCPVECLGALPGAAVYGSHPYDSNSSVCLSAIHAGVLNASTGGAVHVARFYPQDWSASNTQTIYPDASASASLAHSIQSAAVPPSARPLPAPLTSNSWTVRGRGPLPRQRQHAPFPARSGHVHAWLYPELQLRLNWSRAFDHWDPYEAAFFNHSLHIITGGRNATGHYLNDVWLFHSLTIVSSHDTSSINRFNSANGQWYKLPDAPFSPRADMAHHFVLDEPDMPRNGPPVPGQSVSLLLMGGETGYACGNPHLGVCTSDIWQLQITKPTAEGREEEEGGYFIPELGLRFEWELPESGNSSEPAAVMPFAPRCAFTLVADRRLWLPYQSRVTGIIGGQLSYNDTAACEAPIETTSEAWYGVYPFDFDLLPWARGRDAPFAPRRSAMTDDAIVSTDEGQTNGEELDKSTTVVGGLRYLDHRSLSGIGGEVSSVTTQAEVYADAWTCTLWPVEMVFDFDVLPVDCDWAYTFPLARNTSDPAYPLYPSASLPVPIALAASAPYPMGRYLLNMRLGGVTPAAAVADWRNISLRVDDAARWDSGVPRTVDIMQQPSIFRSKALPRSGGSSLRDVMSSRYFAPLRYEVDEAELHSQLSSFQLGSPLLVDHTQSGAVARLRGLLTSLDSPITETRRLGHAMAGTWDSTVVSGGRSGSAAFGDWLTFDPVFCFWPEDPSYAASLGAVRYLARHSPPQIPYVIQGVKATPEQLGAWQPGDSIETVCEEGWHFEPPIETDAAVLTCAGNSQWVDAVLGGVRRCVRDALRCEWPFVDAGYTHCSEPLPEVHAISVASAEQAKRDSMRSISATSVMDMDPLSYAQYYWSLQLVVHGQWFTQPTAITVGTSACREVRLRNATQYCLQNSTCIEYATSVMCILPNDFAASVPVTMVTGRGVRRQVISSLRVPGERTGRSAFRLAVQPPRIVSLDVVSNSTCARRGLAVQHCDARGVLRVRLCGSGFGLVISANEGYLAPVNISYGLAPLRCHDWQLHENDERWCGELDLLCFTATVCAVCDIEPIVGQSAQLAVTRLLVAGDTLINSEQLSNQSEVASIGFDECPAGSYLLVNESAYPSQSCELCAPGSSTFGAESGVNCPLCRPGTYSSVAGASECEACPFNSHSAEAGATRCDACVGNEWQVQEGQQYCTGCQGGQYRVQAGALDAAHLPDCRPCPSGVRCELSGQLLAADNSYLLLDQAAGTVAAVECTSCVLGRGGCDQPERSSGWQQLVNSGLSVVNCCGEHRRPPVDASGAVNVLCAACEEGYSEMQGNCVECTEANAGLIVAVLAVGWLLMYVLHRLSRRSSSSATLAIFMYYVQMSLLFQISEPWPSLMSLLNVDVIGEGQSTPITQQWNWCILPLDDFGKIGLKLLTPAFAMALLSTLLALQLLLAQLIDRSIIVRPAVLRAYQIVLPASAPSHLSSVKEETREQAQQQQMDLLNAPLLGDGASYFAAAVSSDKSEVKSDDFLQQKAVDLPTSELAEDSEQLSSMARFRQSANSVVTQYNRTFIRLGLFSYNTIANVGVAYFHTRPLGEYGRRLWRYPSIDPSSPTYRHLEPLMITLLAVPVLGSPLLLAGYLIWLRRRGRALAVAAGSLTVETDAAAYVDSSVLNAVVTEAFKPRFRILGVLALVRRLVLILLLTFVVHAPNSWLSAVNFAILAVHLSCWPYRVDRDNWLETLTLSALCLQTTILSAYPEYDERTTLASISLRLLLFVPVIFLLVSFGTDKYYQWRLRHGK